MEEFEDSVKCGSGVKWVVLKVRKNMVRRNVMMRTKASRVNYVPREMSRHSVLNVVSKNVTVVYETKNSKEAERNECIWFGNYEGRSRYDSVLNTSTLCGSICSSIFPYKGFNNNNKAGLS